MSKLNYEQDIKVNKNRLDEECENQPSLYFEYAKELLRVTDKMDDAENMMKQEYASLITMFTGNPLKYGLKEKPTAPQVEARIINASTYIDLQDIHRKAKFEQMTVKNAVESIRMRTFAISDLTKLHGQAYFCTNVPVTSEARESLKTEKDENGREVLSNLRTGKDA